MTSSTPLPEQGGFDEKLDEILDIHDNLVLLRQAAGDNGNELRDATKQSIRTLVLEEIIGKDKLEESEGWRYTYKVQLNSIGKSVKAEQRKKLGGSDV